MKNALNFMRKFLSTLIVTLLICFTADAKTYYVSNSGNDNNNGLSTTSPWKTLDKVSSFTGFVAGDAILFNRGEVFYGSIKINNSGSSGNPITFGAYGSGAKPVITGFATVNGWTNLGGNIWESSGAVSSLSTLKMVSINSANTPVGRYPNSGTYLTFQSHTGSTSITSNSLTGSPNWVGADVVIRTYRWSWDKGAITSQSGGKLTYSGGTVDPTSDSWGFFIQNDVRTLDAQNEWYYNPSTKKIRVYSGSSPSKVQVASVDVLVNGNNKNYITIDNIAFTGANSSALSSAGTHLTVTNCDISYAGVDGVQINSTSSYADVEYNNISECNNSGIASYGAGENNIIIKYNIIKKSGLIPGTTQKNFYSYGAINCSGNYSLVQYNQIDSSGYCGILFNGTNTKILNNFVNNSCIVKDDGGGIYTSGSQSSGREITGNIVLNTIGNSAGTNTTDLLAEGIFLDDNVHDTKVLNNSVANCGSAGLLLHNCYNITISNNTIYNSKGLGFTRSAFMIQGDKSGSSVRNLSVKNNIFFARDATQFCFFYYNTIGTGDVTQYGTVDSNYYARPLDDNSMLRLFVPPTTVYYNVSGWHTFSGQDLHSKQSPKTTTNVNDLRFEYNASSTSKTISLDANYLDVKNIAHNGSITLAPYTSAVLIKNGAITGNQSPVANAGTDITVTLPSSTATLNGSGTDPDGTISNYAWTKTSGPAATIVSPNSATTSLTGLTQGTYQFQLMVTDNKGATATDVVQVTVNLSGGAGGSFYARAGDDQTITSSTVSLAGWASDGSKTIPASSYNWTKIAGPSGGTITAPNAQGTDVTNLVQGVYQFQLKVTDASGASSTDVMQVTVNASGGGGSLFARAGNDQTVTSSTVSLAGWASDGSKTIPASSYNWTKIAGPSGGTITNPNAQGTDVTNLVQGVYQFQLKVTDASGASSTDVMQVTVNAGIISNFFARAGLDQVVNLPTNTVYLAGWASNGLIDVIASSYQWTKISGPSGGTITKPSWQGTTVTNLAQGVYQFQLKVTSAGGATSTDIMQVTVNPVGVGGNFSQLNPLISNTEQKSGLTVYPNPFTDHFDISINGIATGEFKLVLFDAAGKMVWNKIVSNPGMSYHETVNTSAFARGIYLLKMIQNKNTSVVKLVK